MKSVHWQLRLGSAATLARGILIFCGQRCVGLGEGLVRGSRRPACHDQKHVEDEERDGNVVEERRLAKAGPELIGGPEEKGNRQQYRLDGFPARRPMRGLIDEVGTRDHGQRKCGKNVMSVGWKEPGKCVPRDKHPNTGQRDHAKNQGKSPVNPVETSIHRPLLPTGQKETIKRWEAAASTHIDPASDFP